MVIRLLRLIKTVIVQEDKIFGWDDENLLVLSMANDKILVDNFHGAPFFEVGIQRIQHLGVEYLQILLDSYIQRKRVSIDINPFGLVNQQLLVEDSEAVSLLV